MMRINDQFYLDSDSYNWILVEKYNVTDIRGKREKTRPHYHSLIFNALMQAFDLSLKGVTDAKDLLRRYLEYREAIEASVKSLELKAHPILEGSGNWKPRTGGFV